MHRSLSSTLARAFCRLGFWFIRLRIRRGCSIIYTLRLCSDIIFHSIIPFNLLDGLRESESLGKLPIISSLSLLSLSLLYTHILIPFNVFTVLIEVGLLCCEHNPWNALINIYLVNETIWKEKNWYVIINCKRIKIPPLVNKDYYGVICIIHAVEK